MTAVVVLLALVVAAQLVAGAVLLRRIRDLRGQVTELAAELDLSPEDLAACPLSPTPPITVQIHNFQELAARESWAARRLGSLVPRLVGREVANRAAEQVAAGLTEQGVVADVHVADPRDPDGGRVLRTGAAPHPEPAPSADAPPATGRG
jgi:hypothetical protein